MRWSNFENRCFFINWYDHPPSIHMRRCALERLPDSPGVFKTVWHPTIIRFSRTSSTARGVVWINDFKCPMKINLPDLGLETSEVIYDVVLERLVQWICWEMLSLTTHAPHYWIATEPHRTSIRFNFYVELLLKEVVIHYLRIAGII